MSAPVAMTAHDKAHSRIKLQHTQPRPLSLRARAREGYAEIGLVGAGPPIQSAIRRRCNQSAYLGPLSCRSQPLPLPIRQAPTNKPQLIYRPNLRRDMKGA